MKAIYGLWVDRGSEARAGTALGIALGTTSVVQDTCSENQEQSVLKEQHQE